MSPVRTWLHAPQPGSQRAHSVSYPLARDRERIDTLIRISTAVVP